MAEQQIPFTVEVETWPDKVTGPNDERDVVEGDWRDPDIIEDLDGLTMYSNDTGYRPGSGIAPDWSKGCEARDEHNHVVLTFGGEPCSPFKEALLQGRVLYGIAIARDEQRHN